MPLIVDCGSGNFSQEKKALLKQIEDIRDDVIDDLGLDSGKVKLNHVRNMKFFSSLRLFYLVTCANVDVYFGPIHSNLYWDITCD